MRYVTNDDLRKHEWTPLWTRRCPFCTTEEALPIPFTYLPFGSIIEEDEHHVLISCPRYHEYRLNLQTDTKSLLLRNEGHRELYHWNHVKHLAWYVIRSSPIASLKLLKLQRSKTEPTGQIRIKTMENPTAKPKHITVGHELYLDYILCCVS